ncbi:MAG: 4-hydroxy-3-methylbut-2-enyl diphosphate reductase [Bacteroidales bacterium]|nr:4-hydroxy-3-methylbut-2-enyl diphosphate reductase [Bacteroidales bacterium]
MQVIIDPDAGFCPGVVKAIAKAEEALQSGHEVSCLGPIVHNEKETERLHKQGLRIINHQAIREVHGKLIIRAHGEPPSTYESIRAARQELNDATCPIVLRLQRKVAQAALRMKDCGGTVVLFAKEGHPEAVGLMGHTGGLGRIVTDVAALGPHELFGPMEVFSQTTMDPGAYTSFLNGIQEQRRLARIAQEIIAHDTICGFVARKKERLTAFAASVDLLVFVSGKESSNGRYLFNLVREVNPRSYSISGAEELRTAWLKGVNSVGVSGATSTPHWLLAEVAGHLEKLASE